MNIVVDVIGYISIIILILLISFVLGVYYTDRLNCESLWINDTDTNYLTYLCGIRLNETKHIKFILIIPDQMLNYY